MSTCTVYVLIPTWKYMQYSCQGNTCTCIEITALNFPMVLCQGRHSTLSSSFFCITLLNVGQIQIVRNFSYIRYNCTRLQACKTGS